LQHAAGRGVDHGRDPARLGAKRILRSHDNLQPSRPHYPDEDSEDIGQSASSPRSSTTRSAP
jgi:hypothetical protein